jgi:hypothetical protein
MIAMERPMVCYNAYYNILISYFLYMALLGIQSLEEDLMILIYRHTDKLLEFHTGLTIRKE